MDNNIDELLDETLDNTEELDGVVEDVQKEEGSPEEDITAKLEELEKAKAGLYRDLREERKQRQEMQQRLDEIRAFLYEQAQKKQEQPKESPGVPIDFDENDNPVVPGDAIASMAEQVVDQKVIPLKQELELTKEQLEQQKRIATVQKMVNQVLKENEAFPEGYKNLQEQWQFVNNEFSQMLQEHGVQPRNRQEAIDLLLGSDIDQRFEKKYPGMDFDALVDAYTAETPTAMQRKLRRALKLVSEKKEDGLDPEVFKKLAGQTGFSKATNRTKLGRSNDILDMTDEELLASVFRD